MSSRSCSLLRHIRLQRGGVQDWRQLSQFHYRSHHAGAVSDVFVLRYEPPAVGYGRYQRLIQRLRRMLVGVIVYTLPVPNVAMRNFATAGRYTKLPRRLGLGLLNREL